MSMAYIRNTYGVTVARGRRVDVRMAHGAVFRGTITKCTHHVHIRIDGEKVARRYHPTDPALTYITAPLYPEGGTTA